MKISSIVWIRCLVLILGMLGFALIAQQETWYAADVGSISLPGSFSASLDTNQISISGSFGSIGSMADAFYWIYKPVSGDGILSAQISSIDETYLNAKVGVMLRENQTPGSRNVFLGITSSTGAVWQRRFLPGQSTNMMAIPAKSVPLWLRIVRKGDQCYSYISVDGRKWEYQGVHKIEMPNEIFGGIAITSRVKGKLCKSIIGDFAFEKLDDTSPPSMVEPFCLNQTDTTAKIEWNEASDSTGIAYYEVYRDNLKIAETAQLYFNDVGLEPGSSHVYQIVSIDVSGNRSDKSYEFSVTLDNSWVPFPWQHKDLGQPAVGYMGGRVSWDASVAAFEMSGSGKDIKGESDEMQVLMSPMNSANGISARIAAQENSSIQGKAGVIIREDWSANSAFAAVVKTPDNTLYFMVRKQKGESIIATKKTIATQENIWVKLSITANECRGYYSTNGKDWISIGSQSGVTLSNSKWGGLVTTSGALGILGRARMDQVRWLPSQPSQSLVAPTALQTLRVNASGVTLSWTSEHVGMFQIIKNGYPIATTEKTQWTDTQVTAGETISYAVAMLSESGDASVPSTAIQVQIPLEMLPDDWKSGAIGDVNTIGAIDINPSRVKIEAYGCGETAMKDSGHWVYKNVSGDAIIQGKIISFIATGKRGFGGLIFRASSEADAAYVAVVKKTDGRICIQVRTEQGKGSKQIFIKQQQENPWIKILRRGDDFFVHTSNDGFVWKNIWKDSVPMEEELLAGAMVSGEDNISPSLLEVQSLNVQNISESEAPTLTWENPLEGASLAVTSLELKVQAQDLDGSVDLVEFYNGDAKIGEVRTPPWKLAIDKINPGEQTFYARARDDEGNYSDRIGVKVNIVDPDTDADGLYDTWEITHFGSLDHSWETDDDGDGLSNQEEFQQNTDPLDYFNGKTPIIKVISGNNQYGPPGQPLSEPLVIQLTTEDGLPLSNAPVLVKEMNNSDGIIWIDEVEKGSNQIKVRTNIEGIIEVKYTPSSKENTLNTISCEAYGSGVYIRSRTFKSIDTNNDGIADEWERHFWITGHSGEDDDDGDGVSNYDEFIAGTDPQHRYNGRQTKLEIIHGNNQNGLAGEEFPVSLKVRFLESDGKPITYSQIRFSTDDNNGLFKSNKSKVEITYTNDDGVAEVEYIASNQANVENIIKVEAYKTEKEFRLNTIERSEIYIPMDKLICGFDDESGVEINENGEVVKWFDRSGKQNNAITINNSKHVIVSDSDHKMKTIAMNTGDERAGMSIKLNKKMSTANGFAMVIVCSQEYGIDEMSYISLINNDTGYQKEMKSYVYGDFTIVKWGEDMLKDDNFPDGGINMCNIKTNLENENNEFDEIVIGKNFKGDIKSVYLFERALTQSEVFTLKAFIGKKIGVKNTASAISVNPESGTYGKQLAVTINPEKADISQIPNAEIRYTLDGSIPNEESSKYESSVILKGETNTLSKIKLNIGLTYKTITGNAMFMTSREYILNDGDRDGWPDDWETANGYDPEIPDRDQDALDDRWEMEYFNTLSQGAKDDQDKDGFTNLQECTNKTSPLVKDPNELTDWDNYDSDGDGIPNKWEKEHGLEPNEYDSDGDIDGDGYPELFEWAYGTDINNPKSHPMPETYAVPGVKNIEDAINETSGAYRIVGIEAGVYEGEGNVGWRIDIGNSNNLLILGLPKNSEAPSIDAEERAPCIREVSGRVYINGVKFIRGNGFDGGIIEKRLDEDMITKSIVSFSNCLFTENNGSNISCIFVNALSRVYMNHCTITGNHNRNKQISGLKTIRSDGVLEIKNSVLLNNVLTEVDGINVKIKNSWIGNQYVGNSNPIGNILISPKGYNSRDSVIHTIISNVKTADIYGNKPKQGNTRNIGAVEWIDEDEDGLPDAWEIENWKNLNKKSDDDEDLDHLANVVECLVGSNPKNCDTDKDGLLDGDEYKKFGTSPVYIDSDEDGLSDGDEVMKYKTNPIKSDTDDDGDPDLDEILDEVNHE